MEKFKSVLYTLEDISGGKKMAFKAIVIAPTGQSAIVYGDSKKEIEEGIEGFLEYEELYSKNASSTKKSKKPSATKK